MNFNAHDEIAAALLCLILLLASGCRSATSDPTANATPDRAASTNDSSSTENSAASPGASATPSGEAAALILEGRKHFEEYRNDEAVATFRRALEIEPDNGEIHYRLGLALADAGDEEGATKSYEAAVERFDKILREDADDIAIQRFIAQTYSKLDKHPEAVKAYKQVVRLEPDVSYNHTALGIELMKLAQYPEAAQALRRATQIDPDDYQAAEAYDRAREGVRRRDLALKRQEEELRRQDDSSARPRGKLVPTLPVSAPKPTPTPKTP